MKSKTLVAALIVALLTFDAPLQADIVTDQSRIWTPAPAWTGLDRVRLPGKPVFVL